MSATDDWGPEVYPDHYASEGCCAIPAAEHPLTPAQVREAREWAETEPGLRQRLTRFEAAYRRLEDLNAPEVLLASQRRIVNNVRRQLGEPVMEGEERDIG